MMVVVGWSIHHHSSSVDIPFHRSFVFHCHSGHRRTPLPVQSSSLSWMGLTSIRSTQLLPLTWKIKKRIIIFQLIVNLMRMINLIFIARGFLSCNNHTIKQQQQKHPYCQSYCRIGFYRILFVDYIQFLLCKLWVTKIFLSNEQNNDHHHHHCNQ